MPLILEFFPVLVMELNKELNNHPLLTSILSPHMSLEEKIGHIAAYCNVVVDDYYMEEDIEILCHLLLKRLREKSTITIN